VQREATRRDFANSYTRHEALRTGALWMLVIGFGLNMGAVSALLVRVIPFATDGGFTRAEAASGFPAVGLANFCSKFVWGFGLQRFPVRSVGRRYLGAARSVGQTVTILLGSLGPISMAFYYDANGSYGAAFVGLALSYILGGTLIFLSREPQRPEPPGVLSEEPALALDAAPAAGG